MKKTLLMLLAISCVNVFASANKVAPEDIVPEDFVPGASSLHLDQTMLAPSPETDGYTLIPTTQLDALRAELDALRAEHASVLALETSLSQVTACASERLAALCAKSTECASLHDTLVASQGFLLKIARAAPGALHTLRMDIMTELLHGVDYVTQQAIMPGDTTVPAGLEPHADSLFAQFVPGSADTSRKDALEAFCLRSGKTAQFKLLFHLTQATL